jgi:hypothetical protein
MDGTPELGNRVQIKLAQHSSSDSYLLRAFVLGPGSRSASR